MSETDDKFLKFKIFMLSIAAIMFVGALVCISSDDALLSDIDTILLEANKETTEDIQLTVLSKNILPDSRGNPVHNIMFRSSSNEVFVYSQSLPFINEEALQVYYNVTVGQTYNCSVERCDDYSNGYIDILKIDGVSIKN